MAIPSAYLTSNKNLKDIFAAFRKAGVPETFTYEFMKQLGFASSGDRPLIPVMKALGLLDEGGRPTQRYREYKDPRLGGQVMAACLRSAYADVYAIDPDAHVLSVSALNGVFRRLSDKGDSVTQKMASTFKALAELAVFDAAPLSPPQASSLPEDPDLAPTAKLDQQPPADQLGLTLRHDVHVHLPLSTDIAVYDAIFRSLKANLL